MLEEESMSESEESPARTHRVVRPDGTVVETDDILFAAVAADLPLTHEEVENLD